VTRRRILQYLEDAGEPRPADRILREVLNIHAPDRSTAEKLLTSIIGQDTRFLFSRGLWQTALASVTEDGALRTAILVVEGSSHSADPTMARGAMFAGGTLRIFGGGEPARRPEWGELQEIVENLHDIQLAVWDPKALHVWNRLLAAYSLSPWTGDTLFVARLARRVLPGFSQYHTLEDLASKLALAPPPAEDQGALSKFLAEALAALLLLVPERRGADFASLQRWIDEASPRVDFTRFTFGPEFLRSLPEEPGVYIMRNRSGAVVYVGKARNLKRRVGSYFTSRALSDSRTAKLHPQIYSLEVTPTASEVEALLEEMRLIRAFHPPGNVQFAVHEQPEFYGKERNLLLLVPDARRLKAQAYFLKEGSFLHQEPVTLGKLPSSKLKRRVGSVYFGSRTRRRSHEPWERQIVFRWLAANRRHLNFIDIDEVGTYDAVMQRLTDYLLDPDRLSVKVYYR
jgi:hypothetical protein